MRLLSPKGLFQPFGTTSHDRYPAIFEFVQRQIGDAAAVRILSLGCATGEEVFSLRGYFSLASIVGLDINPANIAICRKRLGKSGDKRIRFYVAGFTHQEADATYDAVFAMAVFRHGDLNVAQPPPRCDHRIRFGDFEAAVTDLARVLKPGGLLIIRHAMFRFDDTAVASGFRTILTEKPDVTEPVYDRENCLMGAVDVSGVVFQKVG